MNAKVLRNGPTPVWEQLAHLFAERLTADGLRPHDRFPSEADLSLEYGASRMTVRRALGELVRSGQLYTKAGKGTYVAPPRFQTPLGALTGFTQKVEATGLPLETKIVEASVRVLGGAVAERLAVAGPIHALVLKRLRIVAGTPAAIQTTYITHPAYVPLLEDDLTGSLTELLRRRAGIVLVRAEENITAARPEKDEASLLVLNRGAVVLHLRSTAFTSDGVPVRFSHSVYPADIVGFTFNSQSDIGSEISIDVHGLSKES